MKQAATLVQQYLAPVAPAEPTPEVKTRLDELIGRLGADKYAQREAASAALIELGPAALGALRAAADSKDLEVAARAWSAIAAIEARARRPIVDGLRKLSYAAVLAVNQQTGAAHSALTAAEREAFEAKWVEDDQRLARALAAKADARRRLGLLVGLSGQVALPANLAYPKYGMAVRYGVRPVIPNGFPR